MSVESGIVMICVGVAALDLPVGEHIVDLGNERFSGSGIRLSKLSLASFYLDIWFVRFLFLQNFKFSKTLNTI